jgi:type I restriction enzyme M protein
MNEKANNGKSLESWIWDAACSIRGAKEASKYKDFILPLIFVKRLCDVFDDELNRIAKNVGSRKKAFELVKLDKSLVRFYLPLKPDDPEESVWSIIRKLSDKIGLTLTTHLRDIAKENPDLSGIIDRVDFNATTHGQRAGEFYTPKEVGMIMAKIMDPEPGMEIYDPCCGSAGLLIKCQLALEEKMSIRSKSKYAPLRLYGQEYTPETWAMANMNMIIHDMEGKIEIGDTFRSPKFRKENRLQTFDRVVANPMWNQNWFTEKDYDNDELDRFPKGAGYPGNKADWGWLQHILASLNETGRAAVVLDTGAASRGSGNASTNKEKEVRKYFVENDLIEGIIYLPENLFYNSSAPGIVIFLNEDKPKAQKDKIFLLNAAREFAKGDPKNYITDEGIARIAAAFRTWREEEKFGRIVDKTEIARNDYNISPSRYIHTADGEDAPLQRLWKS